jgi:CHAD domain-containing protein
MAEAGRKAILPDFVQMLSNEDGSREGENIEYVHDMRVATRRMRSALRLLADYYKPKAVRAYNQYLRKTARALGTVRDLDVLIDGLESFGKKLRSKADKAALQDVIARLNAERDDARYYLTRTLDKGAYPRFLGEFAAFLTTEGANAKSNGSTDVLPTQVRHILPALIYSHLGTVRAYDPLVDDADANTLHALRIEFKRLRYLLSLFSDVLGGKAKDFIDELKIIQDHLGRMNDLHAAQERLTDLLSDLSLESADVLNRYIQKLSEEQDTLRAQVPDIWRRFNTKTVQRQLASAVGAL